MVQQHSSGHQQVRIQGATRYRDRQHLSTEAIVFYLVLGDVFFGGEGVKYAPKIKIVDINHALCHNKL